MQYMGGKSRIVRPIAEIINTALKQLVAEFPTEKVAEVAQAEWAHLGGDEWCCTHCGYVINTEGSWGKPRRKYCEECGAKMPEAPEMGNSKNPYYNSEGYADPTAYGALKPIMQADAALEGKVNFLIEVLKFIANEAGFDVVNRIELRDRNTGRLFK